jgi:hypothetical protein
LADLNNQDDQMSSTLKATFSTRREAELVIERLVQELGVDRKAISVAPEGSENSAGEIAAGSDDEAGAPSVEPREDAALEGRIAVSVEVSDDAAARSVREAFSEFPDT